MMLFKPECRSDTPQINSYLLSRGALEKVYGSPKYQGCPKTPMKAHLKHRLKEKLSLSEKFRQVDRLTELHGCVL